ncbi:MAG: hypothetical protein MI700_09530 [Balneolales bacterium]|nr:hypothetical protein [Balneolales bacterium]
MAKTVLADTTVTLAASDSLYYVSLIDSTLSEPDLDPYFPYYGEYWDSTRTTIEAFNTLFSSSSYSASVKTLEREFKLPEIAIPEAEMRDSTMTEPDNPVMDSDYLDCGEIGEYPQIRGGIEGFNARLELPGSIQEDVIEFLFFINSRGIIDEFKLNSDTENEDLVNAYVDAIDAHISFEPILVDGESRAIVCGIEFEIPTN